MFVRSCDHWPAFPRLDLGQQRVQGQFRKIASNQSADRPYRHLGHGKACQKRGAIISGSEDRALPAGYLSRAGDRIALAMDCPFTLDDEIFQPTPGRDLVLTAADEARFVRL